MKLKLICASAHEPDELTVTTRSMPAALRAVVASKPKNAILTFLVRPKGTRVDWPWSWRVNRTGPNGAITTRSSFSPHRMRVPSSPGVSVEVEVSDCI